MTKETWNDPLGENPGGDTASIEVQVQRIRDSLETNRLARDAVVYRGLGDPAGKLILEKSQIAFRKSLPLTVLGFFSTTIDPTGNMVKDQGTVIMRIFIPQGARAMYIAPISVHPEEYEMLLDHETKFRVLGFDNEEGKDFIDLAVEP